MNPIVQFIVNSGWPLLVGATVILVAGWIASFALRSPVSRQRLCEFTLLACLLWLLSPLLPQFDRPTTGNSMVDRWLAMQSTEHSVERSNFETSQRTTHARLPEVNVETTRRNDSLRKTAELPVRTEKDEVSSEPEQDAIAAGMPEEPAGDQVPAAPVVRPATETQQQSFATSEVPATGNVVSWLADSNTPGMLYLAGLMAAFAWLATGHLLLWKRIRSCKLIAPKYQEFVCSILPDRSLRVLVSDDFRRVISFGVFRPTIIVPASVARHEDDAVLKDILLHELGHIRQRDAVGQAIMNLAFLFLYFHPVYWLVRRRICFERELVVDDWAAGQSEKQRYALALVWLAKQQTGRWAGPSMAVGAVEVQQSLFFRRIKMLVKRKSSLATRQTWLSTVTQSAFMLGMVGVLTLFIDVPNAFAQEENRVRELQAEIERIQDDRQKLLMQITEQEARFQDLQNQMAMLQDLIASMQARQDSDAQAQSQRDQLLKEVSRLQADSQSLQDQLAQQRVMEEAAAWMRQQNETPPEKPTNPVAPASGESSSLPTPPASIKTPQAPPSGGDHLDLTLFVSRYADALAEQDIAAIKAKNLASLAGKNAVPRSELEIGQIKYKAAKRKVDLFRTMAKSAIDQCMLELQQRDKEMERTQTLIKKGYASASESSGLEIKIRQLQSRIEILQELISD